MYSLELAREKLAGHFPEIPGEISVVMHRSALSLSVAKPLVPLARLATAPAARRYVAGWAGAGELHVLAPSVLRGRASSVHGSLEMLELTAVALYARRVIAASNMDLRRRRGPTRLATELRWAWLLEGAARWFSHQTEFARPAIARRLHEGRRPSFPPGVRDALLLGGTVIDLLVCEQGEAAAAQLARGLHPHGARAALSKAFAGRPYAQTENAWRSHLVRLAGSG